MGAFCLQPRNVEPPDRDTYLRAVSTLLRGPRFRGSHCRADRLQKIPEDIANTYLRGIFPPWSILHFGHVSLEPRKLGRVRDLLRDMPRFRHGLRLFQTGHQRHGWKDVIGGA